MVAAVAVWVGGPPGEAARERERKAGRREGRPTGAVTSPGVFG